MFFFAQAAYKALFVAVVARLWQDGVFYVHHKLLPILREKLFKIQKLLLNPVSNTEILDVEPFGFRKAQRLTKNLSLLQQQPWNVRFHSWNLSIRIIIFVMLICLFIILFFRVKYYFDSYTLLKVCFCSYFLKFKKFIFYF